LSTAKTQEIALNSEGHPLDDHRQTEAGCSQ